MQNGVAEIPRHNERNRMTKLLEQALDAVRRMPAEAQDAIAQAMLSMAEIGEAEEVDEEHREAVMEGMEQAERGEFVSDEDVAVAFRRFEK